MMHGQKNIKTIKIRKADYIGHILLRNCRLIRVIEGKVEGRTKVTGRRGRKRKHLLNTGN